MTAFPFTGANEYRLDAIIRASLTGVARATPEFEARHARFPVTEHVLLGL